MKRSAPLRRTSLTRRTPLARSSRPVPTDAYEIVALRDRDCRGRTLVPDLACLGRLDPHHLVRRSQGGSDQPENLVLLCRAHHSWVHENPAAARSLGLLRHGWQDEQPTTF